MFSDVYSLAGNERARPHVKVSLHDPLVGDAIRIDVGSVFRPNKTILTNNCVRFEMFAI